MTKKEILNKIYDLSVNSFNQEEYYLDQKQKGLDERDDIKRAYAAGKAEVYREIIIWAEKLTDKESGIID